MASIRFTADERYRDAGAPRRDRWQALLEDIRAAVPEALTFCFAIGDRLRLGPLCGPVRRYLEPGMLP